MTFPLRHDTDVPADGAEILVLRQRVQELEDMHRLSALLGNAVTVDDVLSAIVEHSAAICRARYSSILLFNPSSREAVETLVRNTEPGSDGIDHGLNLIIAGWIGYNNRPLFSGDVIETLELKQPGDHWRRLGPVLAVPLVSEGRSVGTLNMLKQRGEDPFTEGALRMAGSIAALATQYIVRARLHDTLFLDNIRLKSVLQRHHGAREILGNSKPVQDLRRKIAAAAGSDATVLLTGESGTGKELAARSIHICSDRAEKPFIAINCSAIPAALVESELFGHERGAFTGAGSIQKGKFELADQGTIFLDEIGEMPLDLQPKLLRILEERSFYRLGSSAEFTTNVRIIAATSRDLFADAQEGRFREDLYHRLSVLPIALPSLRDRPDDITLLAEVFLRESSHGARRFTDDALATLRTLPWRGNVRELRNAVERVNIFTHHGLISSRDLNDAGIGARPGTPSALTTTLRQHLHTNDGMTDILGDIEKRLVELALDEAGGNISRAARLLGIDRNALQRRCDKFHLR